jgi:hypothetical protein
MANYYYNSTDEEVIEHSQAYKKIVKLIPGFPERMRKLVDAPDAFKQLCSLV